MQVDLDKLFDSVLEIFRFVLHVESSPENSLDVLEPLVPDELRPHGQTDPCSSIGLKYTHAVTIVLEDHSDVIALRMGEESLDLGEGVVVFEEEHVSCLAVAIELSH